MTTQLNQYRAAERAAELARSAEHARLVASARRVKQPLGGGGWFRRLHVGRLRRQECAESPL
jgi:hypothetical protein